MLRRRRESRERWEKLDGSFWSNVSTIEQEADSELAMRQDLRDELAVTWHTGEPIVSDTWTYSFQRGADNLYWPVMTTLKVVPGRREKVIYERPHQGEALISGHDSQRFFTTTETGEKALELYVVQLNEFIKALGASSCERYVQLEPFAETHYDWEGSI